MLGTLGQKNIVECPQGSNSNHAWSWERDRERERETALEVRRYFANIIQQRDYNELLRGLATTPFQLFPARGKTLVSLVTGTLDQKKSVHVLRVLGLWTSSLESFRSRNVRQDCTHLPPQFRRHMRDVFPRYNLQQDRHAPNQLHFNGGEELGGYMSFLKMGDMLVKACRERGISAGITLDGVTSTAIVQDARSEGIM